MTKSVISVLKINSRYLQSPRIKKEAKSYITVWAEEHDSLRQGNLELTFGDGSENNSNYG